MGTVIAGGLVLIVCKTGVCCSSQGKDVFCHII